MSNESKKIVFFCESVTLAHVARCRLLADELAKKEHAIIFYCDDHFNRFFPQPNYQIKRLDCTAPDTFIEWNLKSQPIWPAIRIREYLKRDELILTEENPDLVIGDMRHTLQISARKQNIPYLNVINGYWCSSRDFALPIPDVPVRRALGTYFSQLLFDLLKPILMLPHTLPFNRYRQQYSLPAIKKRSLPHIFCESDYTAYLDMPSLIDMDLSTPNKRAVGPVLWSPDIDTPDWWETIPTHKPIIYINLGSSGDASFLPALVETLAKNPYTLIVGTASDKITLPTQYDNVFSSQFVPGDKACEIADISITNGGSPTTMQALANGIFSIGVCFNIDQLVNMQTLKLKDVGEYFYPSKSELPKIEACCREKLNNRPDLSHYATEINQNNPYQHFNNLVDDILKTSL